MLKLVCFQHAVIPMPSIVFEIIELSSGEYVLQRADKNGEPLVSIRFSAEALHFLAGKGADVAKTMIEAGIHEVEDIMDEQVAVDDKDLDAARILH